MLQSSETYMVAGFGESQLFEILKQYEPPHK